MFEPATLGAIVKRLRIERGWKLADMSAAVGIPLSTLSKIENDKLTLSYDKLQQFSRSLNISMSELFVDAEKSDTAAIVTGRRSIATLDRAVKVSTPNYEYHYLCGDLRHRRMIPIYTKVTARTIEDFGELVRHPGEEFCFVIEGAVDLHTDFYSPARLTKGEGVYIDSKMGHGYVLAPGCDNAVMMVICASDDEDLQNVLIAEAEGRGIEAPTATAPGPSTLRRAYADQRDRPNLAPATARKR